MCSDSTLFGLTGASGRGTRGCAAGGPPPCTLLLLVGRLMGGRPGGRNRGSLTRARHDMSAHRVPLRRRRAHLRGPRPPPYHERGADADADAADGLEVAGEAGSSCRRGGRHPRARSAHTPPMEEDGAPFHHEGCRGRSAWWVGNTTSSARACTADSLSEASQARSVGARK